jgi:hypothetical protein
MLQFNSNKSYYNPQSFSFTFGRADGNTWKLERGDLETFSLSCSIKDNDKALPREFKYTFSFNEFLNFAGSLSIGSLPMVIQDTASVTLKEKSGNLVNLILKTAPSSGNLTQSNPVYRPVLQDPTKPENELPIPESVASAISSIAESLNQRL